MSKRTLTIIQTVPVPKGTPDYEAKRAALLEEFARKVPEEFYIPQHIADTPPRDVTGTPRSCGILSEEELEITENYDAVGLAKAIAARK